MGGGGGEEIGYSSRQKIAIPKAPKNARLFKEPKSN